MTIIAGVGVLLLAMGVGVLIGRSGASSKPSAAAPQVVVDTSAAAAPGVSATGAQATPFTDDWPAATNGYTVQLQTLAQAGTQTSAVEAAKAAASAKGARNVGALRSADFASLAAGNYVIYSGVFHKKAEAVHALAGLRKSFPTAKVLTVSTGAGAAKGAGATSPSSSAGASESHPAPAKVAEELTRAHGKSYEEKSKNLPDVVGT